MVSGDSMAIEMTIAVARSGATKGKKPDTYAPHATDTGRVGVFSPARPAFRVYRTGQSGSANTYSVAGLSAGSRISGVSEDSRPRPEAQFATIATYCLPPAS